MAEEQFSNLSDEQLQRLLHETFLVEILKRRNSDNAPSKPWWQKLLESSSMAALITVILGGFVGAYLTSTFQMQSKMRELSLLNAQKIVERREIEVKNIFDSLGNTIVAADNLIKFISSPENDTSKLDKTKYKSHINSINSESDTLEKKVKEAKGKWNAETEKIALLLSYFYKDNDEVKKTWNRVDKSMAEYLKQQEKCWSFPNTECDKCIDFKNVLNTDINNLTAILIKESLNSENIK